MKIKKIFSLILIILLFLPFFIFADGVIIKPLPEGTFDWVDQNSQMAFINYESGLEKLIIEVNIQKESPEVAWIIPIPAKPEEVKIDIISSLPRFYGWEVTKKTKWVLREPLSLITYPTIVSIVLVSLGGARAGPGERVEGGDIMIVAHLEKAGMIAEVLTAKTDQALYDYLSEKGLKIERGAISVFNQFIGKDYAFVVSWISSGKPEELNGGERGIYITFPTKKIYYPLIPTSAYGGKTIPITIRILGYVKPKIHSGIKPYFRTEYYTKAEKELHDTRAHCMSEFHQLSALFEFYASKYGTYPFSFEEMKIKEVHYEIQLEDFFEDMEKYCASAPFYQLSPDGKDYTLSVFLGNGREYFISSTGERGKREVPPPLELQDFYGKKEVWKGNSQYTKITINAPSEKLTKDLWMKAGTPLSIIFLSGISRLATRYFWQTGLFFVAILSFLIGGILGKICFGKFKKYALVGFFNLFTILGLILAVILVKKEEHPRFSKSAFVGLFFIIYLIVSVLLTVLSFPSHLKVIF